MEHYFQQLVQQQTKTNELLERHAVALTHHHEQQSKQIQLLEKLLELSHQEIALLQKDPVRLMDEPLMDKVEVMDDCKISDATHRRYTQDGKPTPDTMYSIRTDISQIKALNHKIVALISDHDKNTAPPILRNAQYLMDRVGVSERTVYRLQESGEIKVYERRGGRRYYREEDVERLYQKYRG